MYLTFTGDCRFINEYCKSTGSYSNIINDTGNVSLTINSRASNAPVPCLPIGNVNCTYLLNKLITPNRLMVSCGNVIGLYDREQGASPGVTETVPTPTSAVSSTMVSQVQNMKNSTTCMPGRTRLTNDVNFYINGGSVNGTTISGNWQLGFLNTGTINNLYIGVSSYRDIMVVTKVTNGSQVVGYNVSLSFCSQPDSPNTPDLLSNDRPLVNFQTPNGIVLDTNTSCGYGTVNSAVDTSIISQKSPTNSLTSDYTAYFSFTKPTCNGDF